MLGVEIPEDHFLLGKTEKDAAVRIPEIGRLLLSRASMPRRLEGGKLSQTRRRERAKKNLTHRISRKAGNLLKENKNNQGTSSCSFPGTTATTTATPNSAKKGVKRGGGVEEGRRAKKIEER